MDIVEGKVQKMKEEVTSLKSIVLEKEIYKKLVYINERIPKHDEELAVFKECDGLNTVNTYLTMLNAKILNSSLGILSYCFSKDDCMAKHELNSSNLKDYNLVLKNVLLIVKTIADDILIYRCCKLLRYLAQNTHLCSVMISSNLTNVMDDILKNEKVCIGTAMYVMHCIKLMFASCNVQEKKKIIESKIFENIAHHYLEPKKGDLRICALRVMYTFCCSRLKLPIQNFFTIVVIGEIMRKPDECTKGETLLILRVLRYLSEYHPLKFNIAMAGGFSFLVPLIDHIDFTTNLDAEQTEIVEYVFMDIAEKVNSGRLKQYAVLILSLFLYCENLYVTISVRKRLIHTFISYLASIVSKYGHQHEREPIVSEETQSTDGSAGSLSPTSNISNPLIFNDSTCNLPFLPDSPVSDRSYSPVSDRSYSSCYGSVFSPAVSDSAEELYSPVYATTTLDNDEGDSENVTDEGNLQLLAAADVDDSDDKGAAMADDDSPDEILPQVCLMNNDGVEKDTRFTYLDEKIFMFLKHLVGTNHDPDDGFCSENTCTVLLDYLTLVHLHAVTIVNILSILVGKNVNFGSLLRIKFPLMVYKKLYCAKHVDCHRCHEHARYTMEILEKMTNVAESMYGIQTFKFQLGKKNDGDVLNTIIMIPFVVKQFELLGEYFLQKADGLKVLTNFEKDKNTVLFSERVAALTVLASKIYLQDSRKPLLLCTKCDVASQIKETTVTFQLDDGSTVSANKNIICAKSEYFDRMFASSYIEQHQTVVKLAEISPRCLQALLRLLYEYCSCALPIGHIEVMLELVSQCDRFLLFELANKVLAVVLNRLLDWRNANTVYEWTCEKGQLLATESNSENICERVVRFALVATDVSFEQRVLMFRSLLDGKCGHEVVTDLRTLIKEHLECDKLKYKSLVTRIMKPIPKRVKISPCVYLRPWQSDN